MVKRALPYQKDFDCAEWASAFEYMAQNLKLKSLSLGIVAGKPGLDGWQTVPPYTSMDFSYMQENDGMEWIQDVLSIKGLCKLDVDAVVEHCPPPMSKAMATYVRFSASIDTTFAAFLKEQMMIQR